MTNHLVLSRIPQHPKKFSNLDDLFAAVKKKTETESTNQVLPANLSGHDDDHLDDMEITQEVEVCFTPTRIPLAEIPKCINTFEQVLRFL